LHSFAERLAAAVRERGNPVVVGLDPRWQQLPEPLRHEASAHNVRDRAAAYEKFCIGVIDTVAPLVPAVKPQMAFFEELGPPGLMALWNVVRHARERGLLVILDGKRGDIGSTAEAYARAYLGAAEEGSWAADALTVNPYLGGDTLDPFIATAAEHGGGFFVLVKTSNPGSGQLQDLVATTDNRSIYRHVADYVETLAGSIAGPSGYGSIGAVVGATYPQQLAELRAAMPHAWLLIPGYGSQGATAADVAVGFDEHGLGAIVNNARGIIFAHHRREYAGKFKPHQWQEAVEAATRDMIAQLRAETNAGRLNKA
jgi:orotidine-5'-phosphate decarboxylase